MRSEVKYRGRFAPSPTGELHFGSMIAAVASYSDARKNGGEWLLRIEDIDPQREQPGAKESIVKTLERYGFEWDGSVQYQSSVLEHINYVIDDLKNKGFAYDCGCSRKDISAISPARTEAGFIYPGTCRNGLAQGKSARSVRLKTEAQDYLINDLIQKQTTQNIAEISGDYIIRRVDGLPAYNIAVVADDIDSGITHVVRGYDLFFCTAMQIRLYELLGSEIPLFAHFPLATHENGDKLSKQTHAPPVSLDNIVETIYNSLIFLGQNPPEEVKRGSVAEIWQWAFEYWDISKVSAEK
ncbi:MAG: tRNA glutamyl-Q(34) synthetase GluQRS [Gammaproteobacteria bacterium]|nr:MAG: tRNA glutamyl-Q(34) synthetase GluQRS [Gammaproteobacteria bacterium]